MNQQSKINDDIFHNTSVDYLTNKTMGDLMSAEQRATIETFKVKNFSFREIFIPKLDEENIGKLLALSMIETISSCIYLNVNGEEDLTSIIFNIPWSVLIASFSMLFEVA